MNNWSKTFRRYQLDVPWGTNYKQFGLRCIGRSVHIEHECEFKDRSLEL